MGGPVEQSRSRLCARANCRVCDGVRQKWGLQTWFQLGGEDIRMGDGTGQGEEAGRQEGKLAGKEAGRNEQAVRVFTFARAKTLVVTTGGPFRSVITSLRCTPRASTNT